MQSAKGYSTLSDHHYSQEKINVYKCFPFNQKRVRKANTSKYMKKRLIKKSFSKGVLFTKALDGKQLTR